MIKNAVLLIMTLLVFSCNTYIENNDDPSDINDAKNMAEDFYRLIKKGKYEEIYAIYPKDSDINDIKSVFQQRDSIFGKISDASITSTKTRYVKENDKEHTEYYIETNITYEKGQTMESLGYEKHNDSIKLMRYYVESIDE